MRRRPLCVTDSADSPDAYGYCDFAIDHFAQTDDHIVEAARRIVVEWKFVSDNYEQSHWADLFGEGLISTEQPRLNPEVLAVRNNICCYPSFGHSTSMDFPVSHP